VRAWPVADSFLTSQLVARGPGFLILKLLYPNIDPFDLIRLTLLEITWRPIPRISRTQGSTTTKITAEEI
jgi:hypothetical protein